MVCQRAGFFARALKFGGQVGIHPRIADFTETHRAKESEKGEIDLPDDEPAIVKLLIQYLYEGEYDPVLPANGLAETLQTPRPARNLNYTYSFPHTCEGQGRYCYDYNICPHHTCKRQTMDDCSFLCKEFDCKECNPSLNGTSDQLLIHAKMYEIADKYDALGLKNLVKEKFSRACQHFWDNDKFAVAAHHAFSTTPEDDKGLRDIVSNTISTHMELVEKPAINVIMTQFNGLALGILEEKIKQYGWAEK